MRLRVLFPFLVAPRGGGVRDALDYSSGRVAWYQALRFLAFYGAVAALWAAYGAVVAVVAALLVGMTLRFDYWSNAVEFLAASLVCSAGVLGIPPLWGLVVGLVLGSGRETLPLLALVGSPFAIAFGVGAGASQLTLRFFTRTAPEWEQAERELQHGVSQLRRNLDRLVHPDHSLVYLDVGVYVAIAALSAASQPALAAALVCLTVWMARIDEPRVLTMLAPFAALVLTHWL